MKLRAIVTWISPFVFLGALSSVQASTVYDLRSGGTPAIQSGTGFGNSLDFGDMTATAWATTGYPHNANSLLNSGQIERWPTGLGVCNRSEGAFCSSPSHQVDNLGDDDLVLFYFDQQVQFDSVVIDPFGVWDRDVSFWTATISSGQSDLTGLDPLTLLDGSSYFGAITSQNHGTGSSPLTISLGGGTGNALLFAGKLDMGNKYDNDSFKISFLNVTTVPLPATVWFLGSGLVVLASAARRRIRL